MSINLDKATIQEAIDYSVQQIVAQGGRCLSSTGVGCRYGDSEGQHCAIGWLLDPDNENLMNTHGTIGSIILQLEGVADHVTLAFLEEHREVLGVLQGFHDGFTKGGRVERVAVMKELGIDTSGEWFQIWVDLGQK